MTVAPRETASWVAIIPTEPAAPTSTVAPTAVPEPTAPPTDVPPTDTPVPAPTATSASLPTVGQRVEEASVALTVNSVDRADALSTFQKADDGTEYVIVDVLIENPWTDEEPYSPFYFKVKDDTGVESTTELFTGQGALHSGKLTPGDKVKGKVAFKVAKGASGLVMTYEPLVLFGGYKPIRIALDQATP